MKLLITGASGVLDSGRVAELGIRLRAPTDVLGRVATGAS